MRQFLMLLTSGALLSAGLTGCAGAVKEVQVRPQPCQVGRFPAFPEVSFQGFEVDPTEAGAETEGETLRLAVTTAEELALLAAWVEAVADWRDGVLQCPWVQDAPLPDHPRKL